MKYNREAIKQFIRDYAMEKHNATYDENIGVDDFFSLNENVESINVVDAGQQAFLMS